MSCSSHLYEASTCFYHSSLSHLKGVDWVKEARLVATATLLAGFIFSFALYVPSLYSISGGDKLSALFERLRPRRTDTDDPEKAGIATPFSNRRTCCGGRMQKCPYNATIRTELTDEFINLFAWPSHGGVIVLGGAEAIDLEFLGLDPLNPPLKRLDDQDSEDAFCQRLLLLGAKWWDSEARYCDVAQEELCPKGTYHRHRSQCCDPDWESIVDSNHPPTMHEKRWVKVGWHSTGGLWVSEFDTSWAAVDEEDNQYYEMVRKQPSFLRLARTMDERCELLKEHFRGRYYTTVEEYEGFAFLRAWEGTHTGEVGPLLSPKEAERLWWEASNAYRS